MSDRIAMAPDGITWQEFVKNLSRNFFWQISASHYKNSFIQSKTLKFLTKHMAPAGIGWHRLASAAKHIYIIHILTQNLFFYDFFVFFWKIKNLKIKKTKKTHWVKMLYKRWRFTFWFFKKKNFFLKIFWFSLPPSLWHRCHFLDKFLDKFVGTGIGARGRRERSKKNFKKKK